MKRGDPIMLHGGPFDGTVVKFSGREYRNTTLVNSQFIEHVYDWCERDGEWIGKFRESRWTGAYVSGLERLKEFVPFFRCNDPTQP